MIASHYAEPLERTIVLEAELYAGPSNDTDVIRKVEPGELFEMLDNRLGWAWGYAGTDRRVSYVTSAAVGAP